MPRKRLAGAGTGLKAKKSKGNAVSGPASVSPIGKDREQEYRAEEDFRTLERAEEVRGDGARHTRAMAHGRKKISAMHRVMAKAGTVRVEKRSGQGRIPAGGRR